jgi:hypothetical protein
MANPNIVNVSQIYGRSNVTTSVSTTPTNIVANPSGSNQVYKINNIVVSNKNTANVVNVTATLFRTSVDYNLAYRINVPKNASLIIVSKDSAIYLEEGDSIRLSAGESTSLDAVCSYEIIS